MLHLARDTLVKKFPNAAANAAAAKAAFEQAPAADKEAKKSEWQARQSEAVDVSKAHGSVAFYESVKRKAGDKSRAYKRAVKILGDPKRK